MALKDTLKQFYYFFSPRRQNLFLEYKTQFQPRYGHGKPPHPFLYQMINQRRADYQKLLTQFLDYQDPLLSIKDCRETTDPIAPCWNNDYLPGLDIVGIYGILASYRPKRYIEVGSGNSTKVAHKARTDHQFDMHITSIDPMPRTEIKGVTDQIIAQPFETVDLSILQELQEGDVLFIDNSHRVLPNSDAMVFFMEVLAQLPKGVLVHIHDIYLPYDYPQFMCDRFYSEQYCLAAFLLSNPERFTVLLPNFFISEDEELRKILNPLWKNESLQNVEQHGGSFWLKT
jgi:hypothetical protein